MNLGGVPRHVEQVELDAAIGRVFDEHGLSDCGLGDGLCAGWGRYEDEW